MKNRYNIALIPTESIEDVENCANKLTQIADQYLVGRRSLPHVTICQFAAHDSDIPNIVEKLELSNLEKTMALQFNDFRCITFDNKIFWASLMPDKRDEIISLHKDVALLIGQPLKQNFDPHMTLMSTKYNQYELFIDELKKDYKTIQDDFVLSVGYSDEIGQYLEVIRIFENGYSPRNRAFK